MKQPKTIKLELVFDPIVANNNWQETHSHIEDNQGSNFFCYSDIFLNKHEISIEQL